MRPIVVATIPHQSQRYDTVGDYDIIEPEEFNEPVLSVKISDLGNTDYEFLVTIHELIEQYLAEKSGISFDEITEFDMWFESHREDVSGEAGDHGLAPYKNEHQYATIIERLLADKLGVNWDDYEDTINKLKYVP